MKTEPIFMKFKEPKEAGDDKAVMKVVEMRGDRVLVEHQTGGTLQQQAVYLLKDLVKVKQYRINLESVGNPDYAQYAPVSNPETATVTTFKEASKVCREYIEKWNLGGGNWPSCAVIDIATHKKVASVSYNCRVWDLDGKEVEI